MSDVGSLIADVFVKEGAMSRLFSKMSGSFLLFHIARNKKDFTVEYLPREPWTAPDGPGDAELFNAIFPGNKVPKDMKTTLLTLLDDGQTIHKVLPFSIPDRGVVWGDFNFSRFSENEVIGVFRNVTALVEIFQSYELNKKNLEQLQENVPIGLFQADPEGTLEFANRMFGSILGYRSTKGLLGKPLRDIFVSAKQYDDLFGKLAGKGSIRETEIRLKHKSDGNIWAQISIQCVFTDAGKLESIDGYMVDISKRKSALEELRDSEQMFRVISQSLTSALYMFDESGRFIYCNPVIEEITGFSVEEALKQKFFDIIHPDFREQVRKRGLERLKGESVPPTYEVKILTRDKHEKWLEIHASRILLKGKPVVLGLANDITDRKLAMDTIQRSEEKYKTLYSFFRLMADNVPDMIWAKNLKNEYIFVNKALCENLLMAGDVEEPIGKTQQFFAERERALHPDDPDWYTFGDRGPDTDAIVLHNKRYQTFEESGTIRGEHTYLDVHKAPLVDDEGHIIGTVGSARNVTRQRVLEEERFRDELIKNVVYRINNAIRTTKDLNELYTVIRLELSHVINTENMFIALYDKRSKKLSLPYFVDERDRFSGIPGSKSLTHYLIRKTSPCSCMRRITWSFTRPTRLSLWVPRRRYGLGSP